eukprot:3212924-Rhodomonas_salina.2
MQTLLGVYHQRSLTRISASEDPASSTHLIERQPASAPDIAEERARSRIEPSSRCRYWNKLVAR